VDENHELATQYNVSTIPYLVIFKNGEKVTDFVGMRQADVLVEAINKLP
jgi:thioredoxin-like negative regulator of GroEL